VKACPASWADLFDTAKFPGKRTFYKWSAPGVIEAALLADGVAADKLYPLDLDRAFKKLDTIKADIVWWSGGAQSQQLLASAEAPFGSFWNGRLTALSATGVNVETSWAQNITAADALVVPKGTKNKEAAMKFIAFAASPEGQAEMAAGTGYAPTNLKSPALMDAKIAKTLPDQQTASQINADMAYWAKHRDEIGERPREVRIEADAPERAALARRFDLQARLRVVQGVAPEALAELQVLARPQAVFVGGGFDAELFDRLQALMPAGCRLVVNAVTLETEALLVQLQAQHGGQLLRLEISSAEPLGRMRSWKAARPLVQWSWQR